MRVLLIRHATTDEVGRVLTGWKAGVPLNAQGRAQAEALAERLQHVPLRAVYTSPIERALETARTIGQRRGLEPVVREALGEIRLGDWTGRRLDSLEGDAAWRRFNSFRSGSRPPAGEGMLEVQARVVAEIQRLRDAHAGEVVAAVSHGDVIKGALFHFAGVSLDLVHRFEISTASLSVLEIDEWGATIVAVNDGGGVGGA